MAFKAIVLCAFALMVQSTAGQSCYRSAPLCSSPSTSSYSSSSNSGCQSISIPSSTLSYSSLSNSGCQSISIPSSGGDFLITAVGPIAPSGIAVATDLGLAGDLDVFGTLPYLSAVAFEGQFETSGSAPVSYGCGDCVAITQQIGGSSTGSVSGSGISSSYGSGCGCRR